VSAHALSHHACPYVHVISRLAPPCAIALRLSSVGSQRGGRACLHRHHDRLPLLCAVDICSSSALVMCGMYLLCAAAAFGAFKVRRRFGAIWRDVLVTSSAERERGVELYIRGLFKNI